MIENEGCFHVSITGVWLSRLKSRNRERSNLESFLLPAFEGYLRVPANYVYLKDHLPPHRKAFD